MNINWNTGRRTHFITHYRRKIPLTFIWHLSRTNIFIAEIQTKETKKKTKFKCAARACLCVVLPLCIWVSECVFVCERGCLRRGVNTQGVFEFSWDYRFLLNFKVKHNSASWWPILFTIKTNVTLKCNGIYKVDAPSQTRQDVQKIIKINQGSGEKTSQKVATLFIVVCIQIWVFPWEIYTAKNRDKIEIIQCTCVFISSPILWVILLFN